MVSTDLVRSRAFYETGLGWKSSSASHGDVVFFQVGASLAEDAGVPADGAGFGGVTIAHDVRDPADVDRLLAVAGAKITKTAQDAFWGGRAGYFADPEGHLWEVAWNPHFEIADDGALWLP